MARKTIVQIKADIVALIEDNVVGSITPLDLRTVLDDIVTAISPSIGRLISTGNAIQIAITQTPRILTWQQFQTGTYPQFTQTNLQTINNTENSVIGVNVALNIGGGNQKVVTAEVYRNGVATGAKQTVLLAGTDKPISMTFSFTDSEPNIGTYDVRVSGDNGDILIDNAMFALRGSMIYG